MDPNAIRYFVNEPVEFVRRIIGAEPDPIQIEILGSIAKYPRTSVRSGHGIGKSTVEAWAILWFMMTRPHPKIPCTAPTKHQLWDILWSEVAKWQGHSPILRETLEWTYEKLYFKGNQETWFAVPRTATNPDAMQGFHADHLLFIIDEGSGVSDKVFEPVLGAMSTPDAKLLVCGNPTQISGFFYDSHTKNRKLYNAIKASSADSPRVSPEYVKLIADMFGEDSDVFRVRVAGEFPNAIPDSFIRLDWVEDASGNADESKPLSRIDIGVDVARFGDDESVLFPVFDKCRAQLPEIYKHNDTMTLTGHVVQLVKRLRHVAPNVPIHIKVDCDGLGVGVYDRLEELNHEGKIVNDVYLHECHFGGRGGKVSDDDPIEYENSTGLMWGFLRELLRTKQLSMPRDDTLIAQLSNRKYQIASSGAIKLEQKKDMKKRGVDSPDRADALALALYDPPRAGEFVTVTM